MTLFTKLSVIFSVVVLASCGGGGGGGSSGSGGNVVNTNLTFLNISSGFITPGFSSGQLSYTATVTFPTDMITITATPAANTATVTINGNATDNLSSVTLPLVVGENAFTIVVNSGGSTKQYIVTITRQAVFDIQTYLKTGDPEADDVFGTSVSISGDTMVVGAPKEDSDGSSEADNSSLDSGAVFVFVRNNNNGWFQQAYIKASNVGDDDSFGNSVSISGDTLVVGAPFEDSDGSSEGDNSSDNAGAVYVFTRSAGSWTQQAYLKASNADIGDQFGSSVAVNDDSLVVGALAEASDGSSDADNSMAGSGAAYVFIRNGTAWSQQAYLKASNVGIDDNFGSHVAISNDTVVVAATGEDSDGSSEADNSMSAAGAAYVYTRAGTVWSQQSYLKASNPDADDAFASSTSVDDDTIVIGASGESSDGSSEADNSVSGSGAAYVFTRTGSAWTQQAYVKASNIDAADGFGNSIAVQSDSLVVGAANEAGDGSDETDNSAANAGAVYFFTRSAGVWTQQNYIKPFNTEAGDNFASSLDIDDGLIVVGAINEDSDRINGQNNAAESSGAGYIYQ